MTKKPGEILAKQTLALYWQETRKSKKDFALSWFLQLGAVFNAVIVPFFASNVLASIVGSGEHTWRYFYLFVGSAAFGLLFDRIGVAYNMRFQANTMGRLHDLVFGRLLKRSVGFYTNQIGGKLISDSLDFVNSYSILVINALIKGFTFLSIIVIGVIVILLQSWQIGLCLLGTLLVIAVWTVRDNKKRNAYRKKRLVALKALTSHLSDNLVNMITVKTFAREQHEFSKSKALNERLTHLRATDWVRTTRNENNRISVLVFAQAILVLVMILSVQKNPALLATSIFAFTYTMTLLNRFFEINTIVRQIDEALINSSPMTKILLEDIEITDSENAKDLRIQKGEISFDAIEFHYADTTNKDLVFDGLTLNIKPGEKIGLVGHSGGGKSTLTRLILRFDELTGGAILIDGQDIREVSQTSLREAVSYVPQEPLLFHRSIKENIAYGQPDASDEEIIHAASLAHAHTFIEKLPEGYNTIVGERGVKLSGGQRQRVAIARAILKNAPLLVLDEATSALDSESEKTIQSALWELMKHKTAIVVAHRLSTIQKLDRIIVLDNGKIAEEGPHEKLLAKPNGIYARLWKHQSGGFIEE
ncbi:MAG: ABC transporter ATP-binding protein [Candidatus Saccharimonadales bacterium]